MKYGFAIDELARPLAEPGMLGELNERRGRIHVEVRLITETYPHVQELKRAVAAAVPVTVAAPASTSALPISVVSA